MFFQMMVDMSNLPHRHTYSIMLYSVIFLCISIVIQVELLNVDVIYNPRIYFTAQKASNYHANMPLEMYSFTL